MTIFFVLFNFLMPFLCGIHSHSVCLIWMFGIRASYFDNNGFSISLDVFRTV